MLRPTGLGSGNAAQQLGAPYCLSREADRAGEASAPAGEGQRGRSSSVLARLRSARTAWVLRRAQAASPCVMALDSEHPFIVGFRGFAYISDAQMTTMPDREHVHVRSCQPICTGSPAMRKTTGMFEVAVLAASAAAVGIVRMRATWRRTEIRYRSVPELPSGTARRAGGSPWVFDAAFAMIAQSKRGAGISRTALMSAQNGHLVWPGFAPCGFSHVGTAKLRTFAY